MRLFVVLGLLSVLPVSILGQGSAGGAGAPEGASKDKYAAESVVHEQAHTVYRYAADGTGSREITLVSRMQSEAAARQFGVVVFPFAGSSEHVEIDYVRVRKPDGSVVETPVTDAQEMPLEVTRQAPFYSDLKEKQIPVRNLRMGDKLEYKAHIVTTRAEAPGQFWGQETFGYGNSGQVMLEETIELRVPKGKYVKVWSPRYAPAVSDENGETVYRWKSSQLEPTIKADGKANTKEVDPDGELPSIAWTTFKNWQEIGAWYQSLESDRIVADANVKAKVAELIKGKTTDEEKVRALYAYVATQIRYIGVAFGIGRFQPHPAGEVLNNQYGDCKDKHTLLAAMLHEAGFHPEAVLIGPGIRMNEDVPSPASFNHAITTLPVDGKRIWLDTTAEVAPFNMLVDTTRDKQALVIPDSGAAKLERTPASPPFPYVDTFLATGTLGTNGTMKSRMEFVFRGDQELAMRALFRMVPPGQWEQFVQNISQGLGYGGTTSHAEASRPDATEDPFKLSYDYEREKFGDWDHHRIQPLFPPFSLPSVDEKDPPKIAPIELGSPRVDTARSVIKLPDGWGAETPKDVHEKAAFANFDKTYKIDHDTLTIERRVEILQKRVPAADWKVYKKWYDATISEGESYITLIGTESKKAESKSSSSEPPQGRMADLGRAFYEQMQRGELNAAEQTVEKMHQLEPNSIWYYRGLMQVSAMKGRQEEIAVALRHILQMDEVTEVEKKAAAGIFYTLGYYDEALPLLKEQVAAEPENQNLQLQLGACLIKTGATDVGAKTLLALLSKLDDENALNSAAYALATANMELEKAEKAARTVVDTITAESSTWGVSAATHQQRSRQSLLIATWDTLGWILYREGKADEAENYIRASWSNMQTAETGLHLGEIEEKLSHKAAAQDIYELALSSIAPESLVTPSPIVKDQKKQLEQHIAALKQQGIATSAQSSQAGLHKLQTIPLSTWTGKNNMAEYTFTLKQDKVGDLQQSEPDKAAIPGGNQMVRKAVFHHWTPDGSEAQLLLRGTLNCHTSICDLVIHPM
jgi:tetratricopeptide (TPR) repeat protein